MVRPGTHGHRPAYGPSPVLPATYSNGPAEASTSERKTNTLTKCLSTRSRRHRCRSPGSLLGGIGAMHHWSKEVSFAHSPRYALTTSSSLGESATRSHGSS